MFLLTVRRFLTELSCIEVSNYRNVASNFMFLAGEELSHRTPPLQPVG